MSDVPTEQARYSRQQDIVPPERLADVRATVVGVGAVGRQLALQLAAMGVCALQLIDFDKVEPPNLATQAYLEDDMGQYKVHATANLCHQINGKLDLEVMPQRFRRHQRIGNVVFCAVDSITTRKQIWDAVANRVEFYCDGRMAAEVVRVLTAHGPDDGRHYETTLFPAGEAYSGSCTSKATIFAASVCAGWMLEQFTRWLRRLPIDSDLTLNLLTSELTTSQFISN